MDLGGSALGLLVTCVDGRPIKVEGNPRHPYSLGATNAYAYPTNTTGYQISSGATLLIVLLCAFIFTPL